MSESNPYDPEQQRNREELQPETYGDQLSKTQKLLRILKDPRTRPMIGVVYRTPINAMLSAADIGIFTLYLGDAASLTADALKTTRRTLRLMGVDPAFLDLTPDVSQKWAWGTEIGLEPITLGKAPTHAIESGMQAWHDVKKVRAFLEMAGRTWKATTEEELADFDTHGARIVDAMSTFDVSAPDPSRSATNVSYKPPRQSNIPEPPNYE